MSKTPKNYLWGTLEDLPVYFEEEKRNLINNIIVSAICHAPVRDALMSDKPSADDEGLLVALNINDKVLHTIRVIDFCNEIKSIIEKVKSEPFSIDIDEALNAIDTTNVFWNDCTIKESTHFRVTIERDSDFVNGVMTTPVPEITRETAKKLLQKSIANMISHAGFSEIDHDALELFTDVIERYMKNVCVALCKNADRAVISGVNSFEDAANRTCHESGIGSIKNLCDYFEKHVINYHKEMLHKALDLINELHGIQQKVIEEKKNQEESKTLDMISIDLENYYMNMDIPELHLSNDDSSLTDLFEPGMQMLEKLETGQDI